MYQIVYLSRACVRMTSEELEELAATASNRNGKVDVTGLLLFDGSRFLQALEGPEKATRETMTRIAADARHDSIEYIGHAPIDQRQFGLWSMLCKRAPDGCCTSEFLAKVREDVELVVDQTLRAAFIGFAALSIRRPQGYRCPATAGA